MLWFWLSVKNEMKSALQLCKYYAWFEFEKSRKKFDTVFILQRFSFMICSFLRLWGHERNLRAMWMKHYADETFTIIVSSLWQKYFQKSPKNWHTQGGVRIRIFKDKNGYIGDWKSYLKHISHKFFISLFPSSTSFSAFQLAIQLLRC